MIDPEILITGGIGLITTITGSWTTWFFARRKYNAEVDNDIIEGMKQSLLFYTDLSNNNKERLQEALEENKELRRQISKLIKENEELKREISGMKSIVLKLATSICTDLSCQIRQNDKFSTLDLAPKLKKEESDEEVCDE